MSHLLELLAKGLTHNVGETVGRHLRLAVDRSMTELESACESDPADVDARCQLGLTLLRGMRFDEAVEHLAAACRFRPDLLAGRLGLAAAYDEKGDSAKALEHLRIAGQTHAGSPEVLFATGYCLEKLSRSDEAAEAYRDVLAVCADHTPALERLAAMALLSDDADEAVAQYERLRALKPGDSHTRATLAHLYHRAGRYADAIAEFETVIAMEPDNWALVDEEVEVLVSAGHIREAIERLHTLLDAQGPFADLHLRLADLLSSVGEDADATRHFQTALDIDPDYLEACIRLGTHHIANGRWEDAAEIFHAGAEHNDHLLACYIGLGVAEDAAGRPTDAINSFQLAQAIEPNSGLLLSETAKLQLKAAVAEEFERNYQFEDHLPVAQPDLDNDHLLQTQINRHAEAVREQPDHADLRYRYGVLLRAEGRLGEAAEQFAAAVEQNECYIDAIIKLGITQQDLGRSDEAMACFRRGLELRPRYVDLHYRLALLHTDRRQFEEAVKHMAAADGIAADNPRLRASLALALQNMGLMDRAAATWRSLAQMHKRAVESDSR